MKRHRECNMFGVKMEVKDNSYTDPETEKNIIKLLKAGVLVYGNIDTKWNTKTMGIFVCIKDLYIKNAHYTTDITYFEVNNLYKLYKKNGMDGVLEWVHTEDKFHQSS